MTPEQKRMLDEAMAADSATTGPTPAQQRMLEEAMKSTPSSTSEKPHPGFFDYAEEAFKKGMAEGSASIAALKEIIEQGSLLRNAADLLAFQTVTGVPKSRRIDPLKIADNATKTIGDTYTGVKKEADIITGATGIRPQSLAGKAVFNALASTADPTTYLPGMTLARSAIVGAGAGAGATLGQPAGEAIGRVGVSVFSGNRESDLSNLGGNIGGLFGSLIGGGIGGVVVQHGPAAQVIKQVSRTIKQDKKQLQGAAQQKYEEVATPIIKELAENQAYEIFRKAQDSDPHLLQKLEEGLKASRETGIPLNAAELLQNPMIDQTMRAVASRDPEHFAAMFNQYVNTRDKLSAARSLFGVEPEAAQATFTKGRLKEADRGAISERLAQQEQAKADKLLAGLDISQSKLGVATEKIVKAKEKAARVKTEPYYEDAFKYADEAGLELPASSVQVIFDKVAGQRAGDVFKTFPDIFNKVTREFNPEKIRPHEVYTAWDALRGAKPKDTALYRGFRERSMLNVDSLKRMVNKAIRETDDPASLRVLGDLKTTLKQEIDKVDPEFARRYSLADAEYLKNVGLPFNEQALQEISRAKFNTNIVPILTKNRDALTQFIDATGKRGKTVVDQAFGLSMYDDVIVKGKPADKWLLENRDALSAVPDVKAKYEAIAGDRGKILAQKEFYENEWLDRAKADLVKVEGRELPEIVRDIHASPQYANKFFAQYGKTDAANAVRATMLDDLVASPNPIQELNNKYRAASYKRAFGPSYDKVKSIATIADRLVKAPEISPDFAKVDNTSLFQQATGTSLKTAGSLIFTNPVVSAEIAATQLVSNFFANRLGRETHNMVARILMDEEKMEGVFRMLKEREAKGLRDKAGNLIPTSKGAVKTAKDLVLAAAEVAAKDAAGAAARVNELAPEDQQADEEFDESMFYDYQGSK